MSGLIISEPKHFSKECKFWKDCKDKGCVRELKAAYGKNWRKPNATIIWSIELCYALKDLEKKGLVKCDV